MQDSSHLKKRLLAAKPFPSKIWWYSRERWHISITPALWKLKQEDGKFEAGLSHVVGHVSKLRKKQQ